MKLSTLISVRKLILSHSNDKLPAALAYKFMKLIKASDKEEAFYVEKLQKIIDEFADRDEEGRVKADHGNVIVAPSKVDSCGSAIKELESTDVDKPDIVFKIDELKPLSVTTSEILALSDFIID